MAFPVGRRLALDVPGLTAVTEATVTPSPSIVTQVFSMVDQRRALPRRAPSMSRSRRWDLHGNANARATSMGHRDQDILAVDRAQAIGANRG